MDHPSVQAFLLQGKSCYENPKEARVSGLSEEDERLHLHSLSVHLPILTHVL